MPPTPVSTLFAQQHELISHFFRFFEYHAAERFVSLVLEGRGKVVFTGVGKSGFIANKIAMSFASTGTAASFLNPLDALHGDIATLAEEDVLVMLSKSGSTEELIKLALVGRSRCRATIAVTCTPRNPLQEMSSLHVHLPLQRELCIINSAPVTSTILQLIFGDTVTVALMGARGLSEESFAVNHPAGAIGRRLLLRVDDILIPSHSLPLVNSSCSVREAVCIMTSGKLGCVFITDTSSVLLGIFSDGDLRASLDKHEGAIFGHTISQHMNTSPRTISRSLKLTDALKVIDLPCHVQCLPVVELTERGDILVGALCSAEVYKALN